MNIKSNVLISREKEIFHTILKILGEQTGDEICNSKFFLGPYLHFISVYVYLAF